MRKFDAVVVVLALVAIVVSASSLYYSMSVIDALNRAESQIGDMQGTIDDLQDKVNDLWEEVFGTPPPQPLPLEGQILKIGIVNPLSGALAPFGLAGKRGVEWAVEEINDAGGILGAFIQLYVEDCGTDPKVATSATEKLITVDHCQVIRGAFSSSITLAMMEVTEKYEVPLLTLGASAMELTAKGYKYIFRVAPNSTDFALVSLRFLNETVKPERVAILHESTLMGVSDKDQFVNLTNTLNPGWEIVSIQSYPSGTLDFKPILEAIRAENPEVLCLSGYLTDSAKIATQMDEMDWHPIVVCIGGAGVQTFSFIDLVGDPGKYWFAASEFWPDRQYPNATALHEKGIECWNRYGQPMDFQLGPAYLTTYFLKAAIEKAKSLDPKDIRDALATSEVNIPWFGTVRFYSNGHMTAKALITQIQDARADEPWQAHNLTFHTVWPSPYNSSVPVFP